MYLRNLSVRTAAKNYGYIILLRYLLKIITQNLLVYWHIKVSLDTLNNQVGHTFLLDTKYSKPLQAFYKDKNIEKPLVMGCFGIGLSRIMAAAAEILSTSEELRWPRSLAPYTVCIIPPKVIYLKNKKKRKSSGKFYILIYIKL